MLFLLPSDLLEQLVVRRLSLSDCAAVSRSCRSGRILTYKTFVMAKRLCVLGFPCRDQCTLDHCNSSPRDNYVFMAAAPRFYPSLIHLTLRRYIDDSVVGCLIDLHHPVFSNLQSLSLHGCPNKHISCKGVNLLISVPNAFSCMKNLCLSNHSLKAKAALELAYFAEAMPNLKCIDLSHNEVNDVGFQKLAETQLEELQLRWTCVTTIPACTNLHMLDVRHSCIHSQGLCHLAIVAHCCTHLVEVRASHNCYTRGACTVLLNATFPRLRFVDLDHHDADLLDLCSARGLFLMILAP